LEKIGAKYTGKCSISELLMFVVVSSSPSLYQIKKLGFLRVISPPNIWTTVLLGIKK